MLLALTIYTVNPGRPGNACCPERGGIVPIGDDHVAIHAGQGGVRFLDAPAVNGVRPRELVRGKKLVAVNHGPGPIFVDLLIEPIQVLGEHECPEPRWRHRSHPPESDSSYPRWMKETKACATSAIKPARNDAPKDRGAQVKWFVGFLAQGGEVSQEKVFHVDPRWESVERS